MIICGLDPGTATTGFAIVNVNNKTMNILQCGLIETKKDLPTPNRLLDIYNQLNIIIKIHNPDVLAIEKIFFATNAKTAIAVGQAQGVMFLASALSNKNLFEYAPGTIKKMVTGDGRADKKKIQEFVMKIFGDKIKAEKGKKTHFDNTADALAIVACHVYKVGLLEGGDIDESKSG